MKKTDKIKIVSTLLIFLLSCSKIIKVNKVIKDENHSMRPLKQMENMVLITGEDYSFYIDPYEVSQPANREYFSIVNQIPLANVAQEEAKKICENIGKRLCSAKEWELACLGIHYYPYSYGIKYQEKHCNIENLRNARSYSGELPNCKSDGNIHDLIGNVSELTSTITENGLVVVKGGDYSSKGITCFTEYFYKPFEKNNKMGFRCCK